MATLPLRLWPCGQSFAPWQTAIGATRTSGKSRGLIMPHGLPMSWPAPIASIKLPLPICTGCECSGFRLGSIASLWKPSALHPPKGIGAATAPSAGFAPEHRFKLAISLSRTMHRGISRGRGESFRWPLPHDCIHHSRCIRPDCWPVPRRQPDGCMVSHAGRQSRHAWRGCRSLCSLCGCGPLALPPIPASHAPACPCGRPQAPRGAPKAPAGANPWRTRCAILMEIA